MGVTEKVLKPVDKTILPDKFYLVLPNDYVWPPDGKCLSYTQFFRSYDAAVAVMTPGAVMYECDAVTRYVCKKEVTKDQ